jgi:FtsH-binding integral membrane protein
MQQQKVTSGYRSLEMQVAAEATREDRAAFISKTYLHLIGAIVALVALDAVLLNLPFTPRLVEMMLGGQYSWLIVLGLFMGVSWIANKWAMSATSLGKQYAGLALYVVAEAIILVPLLYLAIRINPSVLPVAAFTTLGLFCILTAIVFITRADFSFLRALLMFAGFAAMGLIGCGIVFGFSLGPLFTYAMIAFACAYILYDTSNVLHHYRIGQHVAASLALFASVALLFWYILQLFMSRD